MRRIYLRCRVGNLYAHHESDDECWSSGGSARKRSRRLAMSSGRRRNLRPHSLLKRATRWWPPLRSMAGRIRSSTSLSQDRLQHHVREPDDPENFRKRSPPKTKCLYGNISNPRGNVLDTKRGQIAHEIT